MVSLHSNRIVTKAPPLQRSSSHLAFSIPLFGSLQIYFIIHAKTSLRLLVYTLGDLIFTKQEESEFPTLLLHPTYWSSCTTVISVCSGGFFMANITPLLFVFYFDYMMIQQVLSFNPIGCLQIVSTLLWVYYIIISYVK